MAGVDFSAPKVRRGRLTNQRNGEAVPFLYNPTSIKEKLPVNYVEDNIPGASDPLISFASGGAKEISFTLTLCGESSLRRRKGQILNAARGDVEILSGDDFSIAGEIDFFRQFAYPTDPKDSQADGAPDRVVLTFGRLYDGVVCTIHNIDLDITEFSPGLDPTKATVALTMKRYVTKSVFSNQIFLRGGG